jgi:hypothetical protein
VKITNELGIVVECYDYLPFGRMLRAQARSCWDFCFSSG